MRQPAPRCQLSDCRPILFSVPRYQAERKPLLHLATGLACWSVLKRKLNCSIRWQGISSSRSLEPNDQAAPSYDNRDSHFIIVEQRSVSRRIRGAVSDSARLHIFTNCLPHKWPRSPTILPAANRPFYHYRSVRFDARGCTARKMCMCVCNLREVFGPEVCEEVAEFFLIFSCVSLCVFE